MLNYIHLYFTNDKPTREQCPESANVLKPRNYLSAAATNNDYCNENNNPAVLITKKGIEASHNQ
jgi:hypothetical protein